MVFPTGRQSAQIAVSTAAALLLATHVIHSFAEPTVLRPKAGAHAAAASL